MNNLINNDKSYMSQTASEDSLSGENKYTDKSEVLDIVA